MITAQSRKEVIKGTEYRVVKLGSCMYDLLSRNVREEKGLRKEKEGVIYTYFRYY